jgi:mannose-6-phosphate isomerase-like protein (cupin superfamily)
MEVELTPWRSRGGSGVFVNLEGTGGFNDAYVCEIPPRQSLSPVRHIYEDTVFILKGQGATTVWIDENRKQTFEWHERSYFAIPPNAWFQHHNLSGNEPARYIGMTSAPTIINAVKNLDFIFNNPYPFKGLFDGDEGYFKEQAEPTEHVTWRTNFVSDVLARNEMPNTVDNVVSARVNPFNTTTSFAMVNATMSSHSSSWPVGTYKAGYRHGPGIHIVILRGQGYSLMWQEGQPVERIDWGPGSLFVPPEMCFHQHFNTGTEPVLFLAMGAPEDKPKSGGGAYLRDVPTSQGGDRIVYEDEDPAIHRDFEAALARVGVTCRMGGIHPLCTQK